MRKVKFRLSYDRMERLERLAHEALADNVVGTVEETLLKLHVAEFMEMIQKALFRNTASKYTINLTESAALAFCMYWGAQDLTAEPYDDVIVREMIGTIDKQSKQIRVAPRRR
jgi:hypothetical protein